MRRCAVLVLLVVMVAATQNSAQAQWLKLTLPDTPRNADGTPNLNASMPRTSDGKPDLSGIWHRRPGEVIRDLAAGNPNVVLRPAAQALYSKRLANGGAGRPAERCLPDSVPEGLLFGTPNKFVQTRGVLIVLYEQSNHYRQIFTDGRAFPESVEPTWLGYSIAKWDGDTLVAETVGLGEQTWLDTSGHPHSDALRLTERFRRTNFGHMEIEFTFEDPKMYEKPWGRLVHFDLMADTELIENICENEKDAVHIAGK
jgi:hypothetical protein